MEPTERRARIKRLLTIKYLIEEELAQYAAEGLREMDRMLQGEATDDEGQPQDSPAD